MKTGKRQGGAPTINDVARLAGVSPMTVSRVINGESNVRAATRAAVRSAIEALRYVPNPAARALASAARQRIALLYSNPSAAYLSEFLVGSLDQASQSEVHLVVEKCEPGAHELEVAQGLIAGGIGGFILPPPLCDSARLVAMLAGCGVPAVQVGTARPVPQLHSVSIDDAAAAFAMTSHLVQLGHERIGFILGSQALSASTCRLSGYRAALAAAGIAVEPALIVQGLFTFRSGLAAAQQLLDLADPPTAIFASNDDMAAGAVSAAHRRGLDVPADLTVCGFDDTALATATWPELTTIHQPIAAMTRVAVATLTSVLRGRTLDADRRHAQLGFELVRRQSDAAPRRRHRAP